MDFDTLYIGFVIVSIIFQMVSEINVGKKQKEPGDVSFRWTYPVMAGSYLILTGLTFTEFFIVPRKINYIVSIAGLIMFIAGILGREWAIKTLDKYWSLQIETRNSQKLVKTGPYRYLRHPNYLSVALKGIGFTLIPNAYVSFLFSLIVYFPIILLRTYLEEIKLEKIFGQEYNDYRQEVHALFPFNIGRKGA